MLKINAVVGLMIARCRESLGLTPSEAAWRCQLDLDVYQNIERGQEDFDIMLLEKIAIGLELSYDDIRPAADPKKMC